MENATKALLIAAAVLIAILIISLGVTIYTKAAETTGNLDLSEYEITQFNEKFKKYEGDDVTGSQVNAMIQTVFNHNQNQPDTDSCVEVTGDATVAATNNSTSSPDKVSTGSRYTVELTYDATTKLVTTITVTEN